MTRQHQLEVASLKNSKNTTKMIKSLNSESERLKSFSKKMPNRFLMSLKALQSKKVNFYLF